MQIYKLICKSMPLRTPSRRATKHTTLIGEHTIRIETSLCQLSASPKVGSHPCERYRFDFFSLRPYLYKPVTKDCHILAANLSDHTTCLFCIFANVVEKSEAIFYLITANVHLLLKKCARNRDVARIVQ